MYDPDEEMRKHMEIMGYLLVVIVTTIVCFCVWAISNLFMVQ